MGNAGRHPAHGRQAFVFPHLLFQALELGEVGDKQHLPLIFTLIVQDTYTVAEQVLLAAGHGNNNFPLPAYGGRHFLLSFPVAGKEPGKIRRQDLIRNPARGVPTTDAGHFLGRAVPGGDPAISIGCNDAHRQLCHQQRGKCLDLRQGPLGHPEPLHGGE